MLFPLDIYMTICIFYNSLFTLTCSRFTNLVQISLRQCQVSSAGEIGDAVPAVEELDLSRNLFSSWCIVAKICGHLPVLQELNLRYYY